MKTTGTTASGPVSDEAPDHGDGRGAERRADPKSILKRRTELRGAWTGEEERFRRIFEAAPEGIFVAGPDGVYTDVNAAGCRLLGYTRDELLGRSIVEFVAPDEVPRQAAFKARLLESETEATEWLLRRKDGTYVPVELAATALPGGQLLGFARDITERHRADEVLRVATAKFSEIIDISVDAIIFVDRAQRITMFNAGAETIFGYSKDEIIGAPLEKLIPERFRAKHGEHVKTFTERHETSRRMGARQGEILGLRKNGEEFQAEAAISKTEVGGETLLTVSLRDVSERKRAENEERLLAEMGEILVTAGSDHERLLTNVAGAIVRDMADWCSVDVLEEGSIRRLRVVHSDPAKASICEALERHVVSKPAGAVPIALETRASVLMSDVPAGYLESIATNAEHLRLMRALDPGSFIVVPLVARGQSLGTLGLGASKATRRYGPRDVHLVERLASRVALAIDNARLHAALERALGTRDEVLGIVAHDLRNPLNGIVLTAQSLRLPSDQRRDKKPVERILRAAKRMNALIQDLLDVARLEGGQRLTIARDAVQVESLLAEAVDHQETATSASRRILTLDAAGGLPDVWADRARILQVFDNLVGNAIKFSRKRITIGAVLTEAKEVHFWVADDGAGVSPESVQRLFDRFWQASSTDGRGAGLGLSIVKGIVEAHGGKVWTVSEEGLGTTFHFTLPTSSTPPSTAPSSSSRTGS